MGKELNIAVLTDSSLPDMRVEKNLLLHMEANREGNIYLIGRGRPAVLNDIIKYLNLPLSYKFISLESWPSYARLGVRPFYDWFKKKIGKILNKVKPDFVYAHNIFAAKIAYDLGYPVVLDDHELFPVRYRYIAERGTKKNLYRFRARVKAYIWYKWEQELANNVLAIVTVNNYIKRYYVERHNLKNVFVIPNFPHSYEVKTSELYPIPIDVKQIIDKYRNNKLLLGYIGPGVLPPVVPYRNLTFIKDIIKPLSDKMILFLLGTKRKAAYYDSIIGLGYVYHLQLYRIMQEMHIGLCSWTPHPFHIFSNPNKVFIYIHAGLISLLTSSLKEVIRFLKPPHAIIIDDPISELKDILIDLYRNKDDIENTRDERKAYAAENLVFDKFIDVLQNIYSRI
ncbi:MAG: glycosyltransferase [Candidatus Asgardarchaeum sp.]